MGTYFCKPALNTSPSVVVDGRWDTYSSDTTIVCDLGSVQEFTHIALISEGVTSYQAVGSGGNVAGVAVTLATYKTGAGTDLKDSSGYDVNPVINGRHWDLFNWSGNIKNTASSVTFTFTGSNIKIYGLYILDAIIEMVEGETYSVEWTQQLAGFEQTSARGRSNIVPPIAGQRDKKLVALTTRPKYGDREDLLARKIDAFMSQYPEFFWITEYGRYPDQMFRAGNGDRNVRYQYRSDWKALGRRASFIIKEL